MNNRDMNLFTLLFGFLLLCLLIRFIINRIYLQPHIKTLSLTSNKEQVWPTKIYPVNTMYPFIPHGPSNY